MSEPIYIKCDWEQSQFGGGDYIVTITDDHIRAIVERAKELGLITDNTPDPLADKSATPAPTSPVDDEATVQKLADMLVGKCHEIYADDYTALIAARAAHAEAMELLKDIHDNCGSDELGRRLHGEVIEVIAKHGGWK